jgi:hypothetical protein
VRENQNVVIARHKIVTIEILPLPDVRFDRLTVLSLPKEEKVGVRGRVHPHLGPSPSRGRKSME